MFAEGSLSWRGKYVRLRADIDYAVPYWLIVVVEGMLLFSGVVDTVYADVYV